MFTYLPRSLRHIISVAYELSVVSLLFPLLLCASLYFRYFRKKKVLISQLDTEAVGHLSIMPELFLQYLKDHTELDKYDHYFYPQLSISNQKLYTLWARHLTLSHFYRFVQRVNKLLFRDQSTYTFNYARLAVDRSGSLSKGNSFLTFNEADHLLAKEKLNALKISHKDKLVCFHIRESSYVQNRYKSDFSKGIFDYQNKRNCNIEQFYPAMTYFANKGYKVLRMGRDMATKLPSLHENIIDYAAIHHDEFLDIYISAHCDFFIGVDSGIDSLALIFRRPSLICNQVANFPTLLTWGTTKNIISFKLHYHKTQNRYLSLREIMLLKRENQHCFDSDISFIEHTAQDNEAMCIELYEQSQGTLKLSTEDSVRQERFWVIYNDVWDTHFQNNVKNKGKITVTISPYFLKKNEFLLD
jgi:putative glycosyltransferase (TIGR04372 family)